MNPIEDLLLDLDARWKPAKGEARIMLRVIGSSALHLQTNYGRGTKDGDVLETTQIDDSVRARLTALAGQKTDLHVRHGIYIDVVGKAIPFLPTDPLWHPDPVRLKHFDVTTLDVADVLVSKLKRYIATDRDDVRAMIDGEHVQHARMLERLRDVIAKYEFDARCDELPKMVERFNQIERDLFGVAETRIELPDNVFR